MALVELLYKSNITLAAVLIIQYNSTHSRVILLN